MIKLICSLAILLILNSCHQSETKEHREISDRQLNSTNLYSKSVEDSFSISISLPNEYDASKKNKFPVVYILDANVYFDIFTSIMKSYSEVGLIPPAILVGVGYKDLQTMDSLRYRDYTYPK